ncbi:MAG: S41 family peptidase [Patescibacteria group bacterium]|nr:S41 family peptidase [Patescibacteria group bacterium]
MKLSVIRNIILILSLLIISGGLGYNLGQKNALGSKTAAPVSYNRINENDPAAKNIDFSLFWTVWDKLDQTFFDKAALDPQKMIYGAISGMVSSLGDPYTVFLTPSQNKETKDELGGLFEGIGAQLGIKDKKIVVVAPLKDMPAEKAGIKAGDWIVKIDGKDATTSMTLPEAVNLIRGPKGTKVTLTVLHEKSTAPADITITRDTITVKSVELTFQDNVAVLRLSRFGDTTNDEWDKAVSQILTTPKVKGVVLDLRNDPGGYLSGSVYIASEFLKAGAVVIQEDANKQRQYYNVDRAGRLLNMPLAVLINKGSASASEIVAGAMQDRNRGKLVGETSFGKGTIQNAEDLGNGAGIHITVAKWLTPNGRWINGTGLTPDYAVGMDEKNPDKDPQLLKAVQLLQ